MTKRQQKLLISSGIVLIVLLVNTLSQGKFFEQFERIGGSTEEVQSASEEEARVTRVIDGDTVEVLLGNETVTVRLIGINTPETVDPRRPVECFGKEASAFVKELLLDKTVRLQADPTQQNRDRYGRLLRYMYLENGTNVNGVLIQEGYAYEYTYQTPYALQEDFVAAQQQAEREKKGLWADDACGGER